MNSHIADFLTEVINAESKTASAVYSRNRLYERINKACSTKKVEANSIQNPESDYRRKAEDERNRRDDLRYSKFSGIKTVGTQALYEEAPESVPGSVPEEYLGFKKANKIEEMEISFLPLNENKVKTQYNDINIMI